MTRRRLLMVAYHFPPLTGSSGIQRTLRFVQQLPDFGWEPLVLTATACAYERTSHDLDHEVPPATVVRRALALDASRHLSIAGRHVAAMTRPDRFANWRFMGVRAGMQMIRTFAPQAIWSTYPIPTAHTIASTLQRRSGLPWIADFRDPMAQDGYPPDPRTWAQFKEIESTALAQASASVFTTRGAARLYRERYPDAAARIAVIENGYDEPSFASVEATSTERAPLNLDCVTLLHSGIVYPEERDPSSLFEAMQQLQRQSPQLAARLRIRFRSAIHEDMLRDMAERHGVASMVEVLPPIPYKAALSEMLRADALLLLQAANCNEQIPGKMYEYLRAGPPIVALTAPEGDTADALRRHGVENMAPLDDRVAIQALLQRALDRHWGGMQPDTAAVRASSRESRARELVALLDRTLETR